MSITKNIGRAYRIWRRSGWRTVVDKLGRRLSGGTYWGGYSRDALAFASWMDFSSADLEASQAVHRENPGPLEVRTITWFLPEFENPFYGGIHTILRFADYFKREKNIDNRFVILGEMNESLVRQRIASAFPSLAGEPIQKVTLFEQVAGLAPSDIAIASLWGTAYFALYFNQTRRKFYFLQDYEPLFYPAGSTFAQVEATYQFGFYALANTPTIKKIYEEGYGGEAEFFMPCVDSEIFFPHESGSRTGVPLQVFFYGRPRHPRNGFELGAQALRLVKKRMGDRVRFVAAGDRWDPADYGLKGVVDNLGLLSYQETADLYRACHAGLVMMFTRHPSYLPFELMASGALVITNANPATAWFLKDKHNCRLSSASASRLAEVISEALDDDSERLRLTTNALSQIRDSHSNWPAEMDKIHACLGAPPVTGGRFLMRIGLDTTALPDRPVGAGIYIIHLARQLAGLAKDFELVIFAHRRSVPLLALPESPRLRMEIIPDRSRGLRLAWEQVALPRLARRCKLDLLHSPHYTMPLKLPCRSVVTFHDMIFFIYPQHHTLAKRYFFRWFIRTSGRRADALIADSESTRLDAIRLAGLPPEKIHTVHLGVNDEFRPIRDGQLLGQIKTTYGLPDTFLLYVGLVEPRKNLPALIRAYQSLAGEGIPQHLVIAGGKGWMVDQVYRMVAESGLTDRIHFIGHVPHQDLPAMFNLAEAFVYPSLYEGFGIPVLEALACGTPVVTSNLSSIPEITGDCALLVPPTDQRALTAALRRLLGEPELRQELSRCGPVRAAGFTWERTARRTLAIYEQVLAN